MQRWLNILAATGCQWNFVPETSELDGDTLAALEAWQIANNIQPLGIVDDATWEALKAAAEAACPACAAAMTEEE